jgi:hypothetical protein
LPEFPSRQEASKQERGLERRPTGWRRSEGRAQPEPRRAGAEGPLLKLNLLVVLEKVQAQESELRSLRARPMGGGGLTGLSGGMGGLSGGGGLAGRSGGMGGIGGGLGGIGGGLGGIGGGGPAGNQTMPMVTGLPSAMKDAEAALKQLREAPDRDGQRRAAEALDKAMKRLKEQLK